MLLASHCNENTSGMLMKINNLLYEAGLNVDQQINTSRDKISYNVIDIDEVVGMDDFTPYTTSWRH